MKESLHPPYAFRLIWIKTKESFLIPVTKNDKMMNFI